MFRSAFAAGIFLWSSVVFAQRGIGDWMTTGADAQRSSWVRTDPKISPESMGKPGFDLVWSLKLDTTSRQLNSLTPPALIDFYISYRGFRTLGFFGSSSGKVVGIDTDLARIEWDGNFGSVSQTASSSLPCPGGMTSAVTRPTVTGYPPNLGGRGFGRGTPAKSGVGEPFQGAVTLRAVPPTPPAAPAAAAGSARRVSPAPNVFAPRVQYVHALTADGKLHSLYISNGEEPKSPLQFLPPNANAHGLVVFDNTAYVATSNGCGGVENGVWALDLATQKVAQWKSGGKGIVGSAGPAADPDGTLYVAAGGELVALEAKTLKQKASYSAGNQEFTSSPVVFDFKGKDLIAVTSSDGRLHLLAAAALGASLDKTPAFSAANFGAGALASWQDSTGERWVLAPASGPFASGDLKNGAIVAWKVVEQNGAPALKPGWVSRDLVSPLPPIVINGVVFALSSGEFRTRDAQMTAAERVRRSSPAILYALDGATGKELWNSGATITSFVHSGGLAGGGSRVYVGAHDGTQYAFGFPIEH